jgi:hypothetical protein
MTTDLFRRALLAAICACAAGAAAQTPPPPASPSPPTFAVLSLVGDEFGVVFQRDQTGTSLNPNVRRSYPVATAMLDDVAVSTAEEALKRLKPVSPVLRFSIRDPRLFALQDQLLVDSAESRAMRAALVKLLRDNQATRLVLVTKWRDDARFKLYDRTTGTGKISGLGFYVDQLLQLQKIESGEQTEGFLGPYAYLSVTVLDAASMTPIRSVPARESEMRLPVDAKGAVRAWDALTPEGKVDALERVLRRAVESATAAAVAD